MADHEAGESGREADAGAQEGDTGGQEAAAGSSRAEQRRRTEARILAAASRLFVASGYERTTIRGVAAAAGVDAGLVIHYFGSKQQLFQQVTHGRPVPELTGTAQDVSEEILAQLAESMAHEPVQSLAILRSMLTNPEAAAVVQEGTARYREQVSRAIPGPDADLRAGLVNALILGVVVQRHLVKAEEITGASPAEIADLLRPCLYSLTRADTGPPAG